MADNLQPVGETHPLLEGWIFGISVALRRLIFFGTAAFLSLGGTLFFADLLNRLYGTLDGPAIVLIALFFVLFSMVSLGFTHALFGFFVAPIRGLNITSRLQSEDLQAGFDRTAIVIPVYNEPVAEVFERLRAVYLSVQRTGRIEDFEFFVLSDSTSTDHWVAEEYEWAKLCRELDAFGRIYYRRRALNINKKSGNIADFCRTWGGRYSYMIVLDADSVMEGPDIIQLVALMQKSPKIGLIQTAPRVVGGCSLIGKVQQFANRLYGPMFTAGLNFWQRSEGNYWGHNAIIRVTPFTDYCDLPDLPGKEPFGGKILSHDFVEAALMRKAGWEVWLAWDLKGSYEESPQSLLELAQRDRRWLQGNLQHTWLLFAKGLHPANKVHLAMGILGYLASPLWLWFLVVSMLLFNKQKQTGLSIIPVDGLFSQVVPGLSVSHHGILLFAGTMGVLFAPKIFVLIQAALSARFRKSFGGLRPILSGVIIETLVSTLVAPIFMLFHSKFLVWTFLGKSVRWDAQVRGSAGTSWKTAAKAHAAHCLIGCVWGVLALMLDRSLFLWMLPVLLGLICSIPISVYTSRTGLSEALSRSRLLLTPDDTGRPWELVEISRRLEESRPQVPSSAELAPFEGISRAIVDPYVNSVHVTLQDAQSSQAEGLGGIADRLATLGPENLTPAETQALMASPEHMLTLHRLIWTTPFAELAPWWRHVVTGYRRAP
jgi:membrane glycosyltransferase